MARYLLQKSTSKPLGWILTDTEENVTCEFEEGKFNETQKFTPINDTKDYDISKLPEIVRLMSDWLAENHYEIIFDSPTRIKEEYRRSIGIELRHARECAGYTLRDVARMTGIAFNHISRIEQGKYNVTLDTLALIAHALDMEIGLFYPPDGAFPEE